MEKTLNIACIYGVIAALSFLLACGYCALVRKKEVWLICLYISVFIANLGYFALSVSKSLGEALLANRMAYLGNIFLPLFMLMTIQKVCKLHFPKAVVGLLVGVSAMMFGVVASQGYIPLYYKEVSLVFVNGMAKLEKTYGPLHQMYFVYLLLYFGCMIGTIAYAVIRERVASYKHAGLLAVIVFFNISIWLIEQLIEWSFEFLSVSYIAGELLLLLLYGMIEEYELATQHSAAPEDTLNRVISISRLSGEWPEIDRLSAREKDVLEKMLQDKKRKEIAEELFITENTVKKHISSIFAKLEVEGRNDLLAKLKSISVDSRG